MARGCQIVRVFTVGAEGGNHLGVVNDVSGLTTEAMQRIAADLGFSETVFSDWRDDSKPPQARIFTPAAELDFAGHPLVGLAWVYTNLGPGGPGVLECGLGPVRYRSDGEVSWVDVSLPARVVPADAAKLAVGHSQITKAWAVTMAEEYLVAEVESDDGIASAVPDISAMTQSTYLFHRTADAVHARFFAPGLGVVEDPATGSAAVSLAHVLRVEGEAAGSMVIHQGAEMGAPSRILLEWGDDTTAIGGTVVHDGARFLEA